MFKKTGKKDRASYLFKITDKRYKELSETMYDIAIAGGKCKNWNDAYNRTFKACDITTVNEAAALGYMFGRAIGHGENLVDAEESAKRAIESAKKVSKLLKKILK